MASMSFSLPTRRLSWLGIFHWLSSSALLMSEAQMTRDIGGWYVAAQVRLMRQLHKGCFLIVEGETDDKALYRFIDSDACQIEISFGKKNALDALDLLEEE